MSGERKRDVALYLLNQCNTHSPYIEAAKEIIRSMDVGNSLVIPSTPPDEHVSIFTDGEENKLLMSWFPSGPIVAAVATVGDAQGGFSVELDRDELRKLGLQCLAVAESVEESR